VKLRYLLDTNVVITTRRWWMASSSRSWSSTGTTPGSPAPYRPRLAARGTPVGPYDVLIAGQARGRGLTLVSANTTAFERVEGLSLEDWSRAES
jgi:predicted nucleic acid-binding protein